MGDVVPLAHNWTERQWDWPLQQNDGVVKVLSTKDHFEVHLDCQFFTPSEIEVRVADHKLIVHASHAIRSDAHGEISREVHRTYTLPSDVDVKSLKSHLNSRGVLTISAAKNH